MSDLSSIKKDTSDLSHNEFNEIVKNYKSKNPNYSLNHLNLLMINFENILTESGKSVFCPKCGSVYKTIYGDLDTSKKVKCLDCNYIYSLLTNTIFEGTSTPIEVWMYVLREILNEMPLSTISKKVCSDLGVSVSKKTISNIYHKLLISFSYLSKPKLNGSIQVDETFFRESQKGTKNLVNYMSAVGHKRTQDGAHEEAFTVLCYKNIQLYVLQ